MSDPTGSPENFSTILRHEGDDGIFMYRIPGLTTTRAGTLLAAFDARHTCWNDLPSAIDIAMMRSRDAGRTWSPMQTILSFPKDDPATMGNGVGDSSILADLQTGTIWVAALWSKGAHGTEGSRPGLSPEQSGQFVLARSDDDGQTWSPPMNITPQVKNPEWHICFPGPGRGIQLRDGTLVFPAQYWVEGGTSRAFFVYSTDHGQTWRNSPPAIPSGVPSTTESQIAELSDGSLLLSMRNHDPRQERAWAIFHRAPGTNSIEKGSWSPIWFAVDDMRCQGSIVSTHDGRGVIFANPASKTHRERLTVYLSTDSGRTWPVSRLLDPGPSAYSCLTTLPDNSFGILYETGTFIPNSVRGILWTKTLTFKRFTMDWLMARQ